MITPANTRNSSKWLLVLFSAILFIAFFIPWVSWDKTRISGADMPNGNFFGTLEKNYSLLNPFPQFSFAIVVLWLIPAFAIISLLFAIGNKKAGLTALISGLLALMLTSFYILFSNKIRDDLGVQHSFQIGFYLTIVAGAGIILAKQGKWLAKIIWLIAGPVLTYVGFIFASKQVENQKFDDTANSSSAYTVNAVDLIREFQANDSLANAKYREKIVTVNGSISAIETPNDSTINIKFIDTTGSYAIFPFHGETAPAAKKLKEGQAVSVKGSCSGGVLSEILGTESITFKRCIIN